LRGHLFFITSHTEIILFTGALGEMFFSTLSISKKHIAEVTSESFYRPHIIKNAKTIMTRIAPEGYVPTLMG
jgi:hypothetical protein